MNVPPIDCTLAIARNLDHNRIPMQILSTVKCPGQKGVLSSLHPASLTHSAGSGQNANSIRFYFGQDLGGSELEIESGLGSCGCMVLQ